MPKHFGSHYFLLAAALIAVLLAVPQTGIAGTIPASAYSFFTSPGASSITFTGAFASLGTVPLQGATEYSGIPLTGAQVTELNTIAPNLAPVQELVGWTNPLVSVVGNDSLVSSISLGLTQQQDPNVSTTPNFDTVIQTESDVSLTGIGQEGYTQIEILMLDVQSVAPVVIGGFHYNVLLTLAGGPVDPQSFGNLGLDDIGYGPLDSPVGSLDLGTTGPAPTSSNLGADLPSGMEGLPVYFDIQFIPLDGGPGISDQPGESIFQNTGPSQFDPALPEPATLILLATGITGLIARARQGRP